MPVKEMTADEAASRISFPPTDIEKHQADLARRRAEREAKRDVLDACLNPTVAAKYEMEKPHYRFNVKAKWRTPEAILEGDESVIAQTSDDAWSMFCDKVGYWPGRRNCRELKITQGKRIDQSAVAAAIKIEDEENPLPVVKVSALKKPKKL